MKKFDIHHLDNLIGQKEGLKIEFKGSKTFEHKEKICKVVSSFANATGGTFYLGIKEDKKDEKAESVDPINTKGLRNIKEKLEQIIQSNIYPQLLNNPTIHEVEYEKDLFVYIIDVAESYTAHQSTDLKYYTRGNFTTRALYDHEIELIKNKHRRPELFPVFSKIEQDLFSHFHLYLKNKSHVAAKNIQMIVSISVLMGNISYSYGPKVNFSEYESTLVLKRERTPEIIYDMTPVSLLTLNVKGQGKIKIRIELYAEHMIHRCFHYSLVKSEKLKGANNVLLSSHSINVGSPCYYT